MTDKGARRLGRLAAVAGGLLLTAMAAGARTAEETAAPRGDLAAVRARGKLVMLCFPVQGSGFVAADLDVMRDQGLRLAELRRPEQFHGLDVEIVQGFARQLGVELEILPLTGGYPSLLPALLAGQGDLVASELTITPRRLAAVGFSQPYVNNWLVVIARRGSVLRLPADLDGRRGAVVGGSSHTEFLQAVAPHVTLESTSFDLESLEAVESGRADFTLRDSNDAPGSALGTLHPDLVVAFRLRQIGDGIAVRHGSDLLAPLNQYLAGLQASGELARMLARHGIVSQPPG